MLDLDPNKEEVDLTDDDILEMVSAEDALKERKSASSRSPPRSPALQKSSEQSDSLRLVVLELDVQTVLDSDLHFNRVIAVRWHPV